MVHTQIPHPFPYQGSKRNIARHILPYIPSDVETLIEPFCGSAAVSIAASARHMAGKFLLNDIDTSLIQLWIWILGRPLELTSEYERLWLAQQSDPKAFFQRIRNEFNFTHRPSHLLYLLARIVKGAIRYSGDGNFNQSPDNRRLGMHPSTMRRELLGVSELLSRKTAVASDDFRDVVQRADAGDVLYMDPPYQGISFARDHRYIGGLRFEEFVESLVWMNDRQLSYIVSYDGRTGDKNHGYHLPSNLNLTRLDIEAGRSSQATLLGKRYDTVESLYVSPVLVFRLRGQQANLPTLIL